LDLVDRLARTRVGTTHNQYALSPLRRDRLRAYLEAHASAEIVLVGEAAGYRGARISGIPIHLRASADRCRPGRGDRDDRASRARRAVPRERGVAVECRADASRNPLIEQAADSTEVRASRPFLDELTCGRRVVAVGRLAAAVLDAPYVRHPSHGGAGGFAEGLRHMLAG
jgi:hypothetical protein